MRNRYWKADEDAVITEMAPDYTSTEIGEVLGRSDSSVRERARRIGLDLPKRLHVEPRRRMIAGQWYRRCRTCDQWKLEDEGFYKQSKAQYIENECKRCKNDYQAVRQRLYRQELRAVGLDDLPATPGPLLCRWIQPNGYAYPSLGEEVLAVPAERQAS